MKCIVLLFLICYPCLGHICELSLYSPEGKKFYSFFPLTSNTIEFNVRSPANAHILLSLTNDYEKFPTYEIVLGAERNTFSLIRKNGKDVSRYYGSILNDTMFRSFKIITNPDTATISVIAHGNKTLMSFTDSEFVKMTKFGFASFNKNIMDVQYWCHQTYDQGYQHTHKLTHEEPAMV